VRAYGLTVSSVLLCSSLISLSGCFGNAVSLPVGDGAVAGRQSEAGNVGGAVAPIDGLGPVSDSRIATEAATSSGGSGGSAANGGTGASAIFDGGSGGVGGSVSGGGLAGAITTGGITSGGIASGGITSGGIASGGITSGGIASGGITSGGIASGGITSGGIASGGSASGGIATGGVASSGIASGGGSGTGGGQTDAALDAPASDASTPDAPGTCSVDTDCPAQSPLCLGNKCAKCATDADCVGRTGPACAASGLCVGCTANKYCTGVAATCNTATSQCVGCVQRSDCAGACLTCTNGACTPVKGQDDSSTSMCAGTCDSAGTCKSKKGQTCLTVAAGCVAGTTCADGYCCDKACTGSCEACDVTPGTCTTLATPTPHTGHTPCTTSTDHVCDGSCNGTSAACYYPTSSTACGTAICTGKSYQAAGACGSGTCDRPGPTTCSSANVCVASLGCVACTPSTKQCSTGGVPQLCDNSGKWVNQPSCQNGNTCVGGDCQCSGATCGGSCVNTQIDASNCGSCLHSCIGGTCSSGQCQPVAAVTGAGSASAAVIGADNTYVYYDVPNSDRVYPNSVHAYAASATGTINSGAEIDGVGRFFYLRRSHSAPLSSGMSSSFAPTAWTCARSLPSVPARATGTDPSTPGTGLGSGHWSPSRILHNRTSRRILKPTWETPWRSPGTTRTTVPWHRRSLMSITASNSLGLLHDLSRMAAPSTGSECSMMRPMLSRKPSCIPRVRTVRVRRRALSANMGVDTYRIIDANAYSVLLTSQPTSGSLYRVALPGSASALPPLLASPGSAYVTGATEDASGVYWLQNDGTLFRCTPPGCTDKKALATGQTPVGDLYQNDAAIFWSNNGVIMRLAK
jgi:hypothetical protein